MTASKQRRVGLLARAQEFRPVDQDAQRMLARGLGEDERGARLFLAMRAARTPSASSKASAASDSLRRLAGREQK